MNSRSLANPDFGALLTSIRGEDGTGQPFDGRIAEFAEFPLDEYRTRFAKARALMEEYDLDALMLTQDLNVRYFTGYLTILWCSRFRPLVAILPRDVSKAPSLIVPWQETGNADGTSWIHDVRIYSDQEDPIPFIASALSDKGLTAARIGTELGFGQRLGMTIVQFEQLHDELPSASFVDGTPLTQAVRMVKSDHEIQRIRRACEISQLAVKAGWDAVRPGMTERELAQVMGAAMYREGAELGVQPSFFAFNCGPKRYKMPNAPASDYALQPGDLVMIDGGAVHGGYSTDFIRQVCLGKPTSDQERWFEIAVYANDECISAIRSGVTGADVYEAGLRAFEKEGVLEFNQVNIAGHGTGMEVHELPWLGERDVVYTAETPLEPGMVLCIEPAIGGMDGPDWRAGCFMVEDKVLVTESGNEVLTTILDKNLFVKAL